MRVSDVITGVATGVPVMIVVGPIALLLIEQGLTRGGRGAMPAALGVAGADLTFSTGAALAGAAAASLLAPVESVLRLGAVAVLGYLALRLWRSARRDLDVVPGGGSRVQDAAMSPGGTAPVSSSVGAASERGALATVQHQETATRRGSFGLAAEFFLVTALNPITILVFTSIVIGGAAGVGTLGWVLGMVLASLLVNTTFVSIGAGLGAVLDGVATARLRMAGAVLIVGLALWFAVA